MFATENYAWEILKSPFRFKEITAPAASSISPNTLALYAKDRSGTSGLYYKDDAGVEHDLGALTAAQALTRVNDTNVTLTLGGSPTTALLAATSLTLGWTGTLSVARGGTGTGTTFTDGSVVFAGASGVYSQDNSNFFWDNTNKRLALGNTAPANPLHITKDSPANASFRIDQFGGTNPPTALLVYGRGTAASPTAVQAGDLIGDLFQAYGQYNTTPGSINIGALARAVAKENFSSTAAGTRVDFYTCKNGSTALTRWLSLGEDWLTFTPTAASTVGTVTTFGTITGRYKQIDKVLVIQVVVPITTNGTGAGAIRVSSLPFTTGAFNYILVGREIAVNGHTLTATVGASGTTMDIVKYDNTYPGADGVILTITGAYEIAP